MSDSRQIEFDIEALLLSALCIFLWLSLVSYDPADSVGTLPGPLGHLLPTDMQVYPVNQEITNWCGWFGAVCAQVLVQSLGVGALLVAVGATVLTVWMFRVQSNYVRASRQAGWVLVIVAATTSVSLLDLSTPRSPVIGSGGYLGAMTSTWLNEHFAFAGGMILTLTVFLAGLLLSTDYVVVRAAAWMLLGGASVATTAAAATKQRVALPKPRLLRGRRRTSDVDEGVQLPGEADNASEASPPVRIRGVQLADRPLPAAGEANVKAGLLSMARSFASGMLSGTSTAPAATPSKLYEATEPSVPPAESPSESEQADVEEEYEEEFEVDEEEEAAPGEIRELEVAGQTLQLRNDEAHVAVEPPQPRVRAPRKKKGKDEKSPAGDSLDHLDDTKLPVGSEEYVLPGLDLLLESDDIDFERQTLEVRRKAK
ncbi:MAG: DNA translocase FtsK 4TM domain-containing protein, partial [Planctomycetales bacterium]|nr:DNA translocase FtsK 4TM domain-containing protein [Planctomycetales bacterium]